MNYAFLFEYNVSEAYFVNNMLKWTFLLKGNCVLFILYNFQQNSVQQVKNVEKK